MLRVIQWATGSVGTLAAAAVHRHPGLELVGALVYSGSKAGRDAGELCGIGPIGVVATDDREVIVGAEADCVLYMPQGEMNPMGAVDDICRLLASGKNVVSTAVTALIYPAAMGQPVVDRLEAACAQGGHVLSRHRYRTRLGGRGTAADHVRAVPAYRLGAGAGAVGLHHLRQRRDDVRDHGVR